MANEDIQKAPPRADAAEPSGDDNRYRRPEPLWNPMAWIALCLGVFSAFPILMSVEATWDSIRNLLGYSFETSWLAGSDWHIGAADVCVCLGLVLGLAALLFGILGLRYHKRHPTAGGRGYAIFGIRMGLLSLIAALVGVLSLILMLAQGGIMGRQGSIRDGRYPPTVLIASVNR